MLWCDASVNLIYIYIHIYYVYIYIYIKFTEASHHNTLNITQNRIYIYTYILCIYMYIYVYNNVDSKATYFDKNNYII